MEDEFGGKEPGGWELYRAIRALQKSVETYASSSMSAAVFAVKEQVLTDAINKVATNQAQAAADQKAETLRLSNELSEYKKSQEDQKGKNRLFVYGLIGGPVATAIVAFVILGGLRPAG